MTNTRAAPRLALTEHRAALSMPRIFDQATTGQKE
jgi:hypothetical protein